MSLTVLKAERSEQEKLVELELNDAVKEVIAKRAIGYALVYVTADDMFACMNLLPQNVRALIGFIETDVKPTLAELVT